MTRRRRRVKVMGSSVRLFAFILFALNLSLLFQCNSAQLPAALEQRQALASAGQQQQQQVEQYHTASGNQQQQQQQQQQHSTTVTTTESSQPQPQHHSVVRLCSTLAAHQQRQLKLCKLVHQSPGADQAVALGAARGLAACRDRFRWDRWNCTHALGEQHLLTGRLAQSVGNREGAFVQAIAAAGVVHSIALACSTGSMADCACDKTRVGLIRQKQEQGVWKWGGCSNNVRHGMLYAKHLAELLDAVHRERHHNNNAARHHQQQQQQHRTKRQSTKKRHRKRRALSSLHRDGPNQTTMVSGAMSGTVVDGAPQTATAQLTTTGQQERSSVQEFAASPSAWSFCQNKAGGISQAAHQQLVKSLLSKNSLEKHQDFRLAMNMHNNKIGRMAVAKNMEVKCRCHGLSGSCSLKTCWMALPDFQQIGAYLRRKYDVSLHLPSAVDVNKLIPLMDRHEVSAILSQSALAGAEPGERAAAGLESALQPRLGFYERHRLALAEQQLQLPMVASGVQVLNQTRTTRSDKRAELFDEQSMEEQRDKQQQQLNNVHETQSLLSPMSQQQFQALLKELRLCATNSSPAVLVTRDLHGGGHQQQHKQQQIKRMAHHHQQASAALLASKQVHQQLQQLLHNRNSRDELIHLHQSPDYCKAEPTEYGFAGVQARTCNATNPLAPDSCDRLCCGRGHERREYIKDTKCVCKFRYCCSISCTYCHMKVEEHVCK